MKIYIGCSLTQASEDFKAEVAAIKNDLRKEYEVLDFIGTVTGTPVDVYEWDIQKCITECDALIAICDSPAIGVGYELAVAVEKLQKSTLALAHADAKVSRLLLGITQPHYRFERYDTRADLEDKVRAFLNGIQK